MFVAVNCPVLFPFSREVCWIVWTVATYSYIVLFSTTIAQTVLFKARVICPVLMCFRLILLASDR